MVHLDGRSDPLHTRALLARPHDFAYLDLAFGAIQLQIIFLPHIQPWRRIDEEGTALLAMDY